MITPEPILFLVSNGLLEHKPRMGAALWTYLWFVDKVTKDEPDGKGKFDGLVLGGIPFKAERIAHDLNDHVQTVLENVRKLEAEGYIIRKRHAGNLCSFIVTNSKKWFWRRVSGNPQSRESENAHSEDTDKAKTLTQSEPKDSFRVSQSTLSNKERHDSDTTKIISSNPDGFDRAVREIWDYYIATLNRSPQTTLTETRKRMARARLKECFARAREPQLENATNVMRICVDRLKSSQWHNGHNPGGKKYLNWEILFRSREQFEKWINDENFCEGVA
jgi:hypothetical protein